MNNLPTHTNCPGSLCITETVDAAAHRLDAEGGDVQAQISYLATLTCFADSDDDGTAAWFYWTANQVTQRATRLRDDWVALAELNTALGCPDQVAQCQTRVEHWASTSQAVFEAVDDLYFELADWSPEEVCAACRREFTAADETAVVLDGDNTVYVHADPQVCKS